MKSQDMMWVPADGIPPVHRAAAGLGIALGIALFAGPAFLLGKYHASSAYLFAWAMVWAPPFSVAAGELDLRLPGIPQILLLIRLFSETSLTNAAVLAVPFLIGRCLP